MHHRPGGKFFRKIGITSGVVAEEFVPVSRGCHPQKIFSSFCKWYYIFTYLYFIFKHTRKMNIHKPINLKFKKRFYESDEQFHKRVMDYLKKYIDKCNQFLNKNTQ